MRTQTTRQTHSCRRSITEQQCRWGWCCGGGGCENGGWRWRQASRPPALPPAHLSAHLPACHQKVAFLAGCVYTAAGLLRLGWVTNFLSHSVISGYMSGASLVIACTQVGCGSGGRGEVAGRLHAVVQRSRLQELEQY